jgi:hypothetical protein
MAFHEIFSLYNFDSIRNFLLSIWIGIDDFTRRGVSLLFLDWVKEILQILELCSPDFQGKWVLLVGFYSDRMFIGIKLTLVSNI